jgi:hypothetical protein
MTQFKKAAAERWRFLVEVRDHGAIPFPTGCRALHFPPPALR